jgi:hypothetical protein
VLGDLSGRYKKSGRFLVSPNLTQPISIIDYWYRLTIIGIGYCYQPIPIMDPRCHDKSFL